MAQALLRSTMALRNSTETLTRADELWRATWTTSSPGSAAPIRLASTKGAQAKESSPKRKKKEASTSPSSKATSRAPSPAPSKLSTSAQGTAFELSTLALLQHVFRPSIAAPSSPDDSTQGFKLGMHLHRTGGAGDGGVDLAGWWSLPSASGAPSSPSSHLLMRLAVQCKSEAKKLGPVHVRELEGTLFRLSSRQQGQAKDSRALIDALESSSQGPDDEQPLEGEVPGTPTSTTLSNASKPLVGVLASSSGFSKACALSAMASSFPLMLLHHASSATTQEDVQASTAAGLELPQALLWNTALERGLLQGRGELRWVRRAGGQAVGEEAAANMWPTFVWDGVEADGVKN